MQKNFSINYTQDAHEHITKLFGRALADDEIASAVGALDGAEIFLSVQKIGLFVEVKHPYFDSYECSVRRDTQGELYLFWHDVRKKYDAPSGLALSCLQRIVKGARALGLRRIELWAGGSPGSSMNGYYTWARLGFDALLSKTDIIALPFELHGAQTLNELMGLDGASWWRKKGSERKMVFDLSHGSSSEQTLLVYLKEKGLQREF